MDGLIKGYRRFRDGAWQSRRDLYATLSRDGQHPRAVLIGCCDSRADPSMIFDTAPGELFVIRNVANLVPPYGPDSRYHGTSAALEFAVRSLGIENIVVLGHGQCGGIAALMSGKASGEFLDPWLDIARGIRPALMGQPDAALRQRQAEHAAIRLSLQNLRTFPWIGEAVDAGRLTLHGLWFELMSGDLWRMDENEEFAPV